MEKPKPEHRHAGQCLKEARKGLQMSRKRLGATLGVTKSIILQYEIGRRKIPEDTLVDLFCAGIQHFE